MKLCIPCFKDDKIYDECEIKKPNAGIIGESYELAQEKGMYPAILEFIAGSIESFQSTEEIIITNKDQIRAICRKMPYITAETIAIKIMSLVNPNDWIEGVYHCPRCHQKIITGIDGDDDTRDYISDLDVITMGEDEEGNIDYDQYVNNIHLDLEDPVKIISQKTNTVIKEIISLDLQFPTIDNCITGMNKYPEGKNVKQQFVIYADSIKKVNDEEVNKKWRKMWGEYVFSHMSQDDITFIGEEMQKYGIKKTISRTCRSCVKVWDSPVNTSNFFVSGLQSV